MAFIFLFNISSRFSYFILASLHLVWCQHSLHAVLALVCLLTSLGEFNTACKQKQHQQLITLLTFHICASSLSMRAVCTSSAILYTLQVGTVPFLLFLPLFVKPSPRGGAWCVRRQGKIQCKRALQRRKEEKEEWKERLSCRMVKKRVTEQEWDGYTQQCEGENRKKDW